jgi:hypothetical protein
MDMIAGMALKQKVNVIADSVAETVTLHQWVCGLYADSEPESLRAVERDVMENGLAFVMRRGVGAYRDWLKKVPNLRMLTFNLELGSDQWFEALDRVHGLVLLEQGEIASVRFGAVEVPVPAPIGLDYSDLFCGHLRAADLVVAGPRRCEQRASGGRRPTL